MSKKVDLGDGFGVDENGRLKVLPLNLPEFNIMPSSTKKGSEKKAFISRPYIPIEPINLMELNARIEQPSKKRKVENTICKELFKVPENKPINRRPTFGRQKLYKKTVVKKTRVNALEKSTIQYQNNGTPLLDAEEAETFITQGKPLTNLVKKTLFPVIKPEKPPTKENIKTPIKVHNGKMKKTPSSMESDAEFLLLEKTLASAKKSINTGVLSPVTSVCSLLQSAKITNNEQNEGAAYGYQAILRLLKEEDVQFNRIKQQFQDFEKGHEIRMKSIVQLLEEYTCSNNKKSNQIKSASVMKNGVSPGISKKIDLRKATLSKSLAKILPNESPRTRRAADMYNLMRGDCTVLCTPKVDKADVGLNQGSVTRSLSRRIKNQCLLLQDTPKH